MTTSEADERMALARELGLSPDRRQWGTVTAAVRRLRSYAAAWDAAAEALAEAELERQAVAVSRSCGPPWWRPCASWRRRGRATRKSSGAPRSTRRWSEPRSPTL